MSLFRLDFKGGAVSYNSHLGILDVNCNELDITYVCVNSNQLIEKVAAPISAFAEAMRLDAVSSNNSEIRGTVNLEFLAHRKSNWGLGSEPSVWERWIVNLSQKNITDAAEKKLHRLQLNEQLRDELCKILENLNFQSTHVPSLGSSQAETEHIIDFSMPGISPYRFNIGHVTTTSQSRPSVSNAMRRMFKDVRL